MRASVVWGVLACGVALAGCTGSGAREDDKKDVVERATEPVAVKVVAFNDLHGHMEGPSGKVEVKGERVEAGGLDAFAAHLAAMRAKNTNTAVVCAGDLVGASPLISALFHDEPTVEAMNLMEIDFVAVGNHEFDEGVAELERLQSGGCHPEDGCQGKESFEGARFGFLAANVVVKETGKKLFPAHAVREYGGVKVGFIGLTLEGTPQSVTPSAVEPVRFLDEAEAINASVAELKGQGVEAIVVIVHEGGYPEAKIEDVNDCPGISGPIVAINAALDPAVDVMVTGHTHQAYNCELEGRLVTSAKSYGRVLTEIDLKVDPKTGDVVARSARNVAVTRDVEMDEGLSAHIARYRELVAPLANKPVGELTEDVLRAPDEQGQMPLGVLIADAQLEATRAVDAGGAQLALMNPGGVRADLTFAATEGGVDGQVTFNDLHATQPFNNTLVTMTLTGAQLRGVLEAMFREGGRNYLLQPSSGFAYTWKEEAPHLVEVTLDGKPLDDAASYRVTVNSFLADGGDGFAGLKEGTQRQGGAVDLEAFEAFVRARGTIASPTQRRVRKK
jgi:5'-nucleotidase